MTSLFSVFIMSYPISSHDNGSKPNFLVIGADDLGSRTAVALVVESTRQTSTNGIKFTDCHIATACSPTRLYVSILSTNISMTMTGTYHNLTSLGQLAEVMRYSPVQRGNRDTKDTSPKTRLHSSPGCANHYGWEPQVDDPRFFETVVTALHMEGDNHVDKLPDDFCSSDYYAEN
jgi:hypothetical protein